MVFWCFLKPEGVTFFLIWTLLLSSKFMPISLELHTQAPQPNPKHGEVLPLVTTSCGLPQLYPAYHEGNSLT